jgi:hypothetical protein
MRSVLRPRAEISGRRPLFPGASYFHPLDAITRLEPALRTRRPVSAPERLPGRPPAKPPSALIECAQKHGAASFLTVLKRFGDTPSPGLLSFPASGLYPDPGFCQFGPVHSKYARRARRNRPVDAGGALNPYKDQRMSAEMFEASFPNWRQMEAMRDPALISNFWRRTAMVLNRELEPQRHAASA